MSDRRRYQPTHKIDDCRVCAYVGIVGILLLLIVGAFGLSGCSVATEDKLIPHKTYRLNGHHVDTFTLDDGTKCAAHSVGGLSCDWRRESVER